ncbi:MAG: methyltransferase domain-containing protein [Anaerolineales bacterium]|nr:methyltransferase domain-containing protein [Anaerolineales bacterium]
MQTKTTPIEAQESLYRLPYHWFPEPWLRQFEREEKKRIIHSLIHKHHNGVPSRYLDVGCGDGRWTSDIRDVLTDIFNKDIDTYGIDFSERAIGFAKLIKPEIKFQVSPGEDIPFPGSYFDLLTSIEVIEHVEDSSEKKYMTELRRVIHQEGLVLLTTPSWHLRLPEHHFRHYTVERLTRLANHAGFQVLEVRGQSIPYYFYPLRRMRIILEGFPKLWRIWRYTYKEVAPEKALNLFVALRPV